MGCKNSKAPAVAGAAPQARRSSVDGISPETVLQPLPEPQTPTKQKSAIKTGDSLSSSRVGFNAADEEEMAKHEAQDSHRKGNEVAMKKVVDVLYDKVLHNNTLNPFYEGTDMSHLTAMQQKLMTYVFGGKELMLLENPEFDLRAIHMKMLVDGHLSEDNWESFVKHFEETLDTLSEIPAETKASAVAWIRSTKEAFRPPAPEEVETYKAAKEAAAGRCPFH